MNRMTVTGAGLPACWALCLTLAAAPTALGSGAESQPGTFLAGPLDVATKLAKELQLQGERVDVERFEELARLGGRKAMNGLHDVARGLESKLRVRAAYAAFVHFEADDYLRPKIVKLLERDAVKGKSKAHQEGAAQMLATWGPRWPKALEALEDVLDDSQEFGVRRIVVVPLAGPLAARGDKQALDLALEYAPLAGDSRRALVAGLASALENEKLRAKTCKDLARRLRDRAVQPAVKTVLLDALAISPQAETLDAIATCAEHDDPEVALRGIEQLGDGGDPDHARTAELLLVSSDEILVREALGALGKLRTGEEWYGRVLEYAADRRPGARMGACLALRYSDQPGALDALHGLLVDEDWRVRVEAIDQITELRRKESVGVLIGRMEHESGRLFEDLVQALVLVTGVDQGKSARRWDAWWTGEGDAFELPTLEGALTAKLEREERAADDESAVAFYGLRITSNSVVLVADVSNSMTELTVSDRVETEAGAVPSRLDVAREELKRALEVLAKGALFNVILFGTDITVWESEMQTMSPKKRERALEFVAEFELGAGTNTFGGLMAALADERVDTIYLMSDGEPNVGDLVDAEEIRDFMLRQNRLRKVRIHSVAVGQSSAFLEGLAEDTGGSYVESF